MAIVSKWSSLCNGTSLVLPEPEVSCFVMSAFDEDGCAEALKALLI